MFVKYCEPVSVRGGKVLCLLSTVNRSVFGVGKCCVFCCELSRSVFGVGKCCVC